MCATVRITCRVNSLTYSGPVTFGLKPSGGLWIDGFTSGRRDLGEDVGHLHRVGRARVGAPIGLVDVFLDDAVLERPVRKRIDRVEVHIVLVQELLEPRALVRGCPSTFAPTTRERRSETPKVLFGETRAFTCGT